jgi:integrase
MLSGHRYSVYGRTAAEARSKLHELVHRHRLGELPALPPRRPLTLSEWAGQWLRDCDGRLRPRTVFTYRQAIAPLLALVGHLRLDRLEPLHFHYALSVLREKGLGSRTLQQGYTYLRACLETARKLGLIASNPLARVPRPRHERQQAKDWGLEDMRAWLRAALDDGTPLASMLALMLLTGLRPGEASGLQWGDVDVEAATLTVRRSVTWAGSQWHIGRPKSKAGERSIVLPSLALGLLTRLPRQSIHLFWQDRPPYRLSGTMGELCQKANVPRRPAHYLRHCHASLLAASGLDVKTLQRRLGHAQASVTLGVYAHALTEMDMRAAELVDRALG